MADIIITDKNVHVYTGAQIDKVEAGEALTALAQPLYKSSVDGKYYRCDSSTAEKAKATHLNVGYAQAAGDYVAVVKKGNVDVGAALTAGKTYYVSDNAGKIADDEPSASEYVTELGKATDPDVLDLEIDATGVQHG